MNQNTDTWPVVLPNDDGIRPAGKPDECFYCSSKVGQPHGRECVMVHKKVLVRYTFDVMIEVPHHWNKEQIEFHKNDSSWCADNAIRDLAAQPILHPDCYCLCDIFKAEFLKDADLTPTIKSASEAREFEEKCYAKFRNV